MLCVREGRIDLISTLGMRSGAWCFLPPGVWRPLNYRCQPPPIHVMARVCARAWVSHTVMQSIVGCKGGSNAPDHLILLACAQDPRMVLVGGGRMRGSPVSVNLDRKWAYLCPQTALHESLQGYLTHKKHSPHRTMQ